MSKNTLQDKLKASIQRPATTRTRTPRAAAAKPAAAAVETANTAKPAETAAANPVPAAKPAQPKKPYFNDERVWPD